MGNYLLIMGRNLLIFFGSYLLMLGNYLLICDDIIYCPVPLDQQLVDWEHIVFLRCSNVFGT